MTSTLRVQRPETKKIAKQFHDAVFAMYGGYCYFHRRKDPRSRVRAIQAAHIISRKRMGTAIAYGPKDGPVEPRLARPSCVACHKRQEADNEFEFRFSYADVLQAVELHNSYSRVKLPLPMPDHYPGGKT